MRKHTAFIFYGSLIGLFFAGCGGQPAATPTSPEQAVTTSETKPSATVTPAPAPTTAPTESVKNTGGKETKWIGTIPYDVFYDQPLTIASDSTVIGTPVAVPPANTMAANNAPATSTAATPAPASMAPMAEPTANNATSAAGTVDWKAIIPMPILLEESKILRTRLTGNLQTVATFNKSAKEISLDASILGALATVAQRHPEQAPWKANAHYVRDLTQEIVGNAEGTGRAPYTKCKEPFEKITVIMDGGKPPEMESMENVPFAEAVDVADMMKWLEPSFNGLKANFNTVARLKEDPATVERELRILLMLGTMMSDTSYSSAEEENYQKLMKRFLDGANEALQAAKAGDLEVYQSALNKVQTTCAECHQEYRGNSF